LRWRLMLEECGPTFHYREGPTNAIADMLSQVPTSRTDRGSSKFPVRDPLLTATDGIYCMGTNNLPLAEWLQHDSELAECFLEHPVFDNEGRLPFQFKTLAEYQNQRPALQQDLQQHPDRFHTMEFKDNTKLICFCQNVEDTIVLTQELLPKLVKYYH
jgi:hypothetical protein